MASIENLKHLALDVGDQNRTKATYEFNSGVDHAIQYLDALVVGAGFGGVYQLKKLRDHGYSVKLVESGSDYGGVWYWNRYPGARVDTANPQYQFSDPALWEDWEWKQRFPRSAEIRAYFAHVAEIWDLRKDTKFDTFVTAATWDDQEATWTVKTENGDTYKAKFFLLSTGFAAKRYIPDWKGIDKFKGTFIHPSYWPHEEPDLKGKKVAIIGTGSTGIQIATELGKVAGELYIFQRTLNMSLPMRQVDYNDHDHGYPKSGYPEIFSQRTTSFGGFDFNFLPRATFDDTREKRLQTYEELWAEGDFKFWLATYHDMLFSLSANHEAYTFWRDKTRAKIRDPVIADMLAPMDQPYAFGTKRISLETGYFEIFNQENVHLVDVNATPIQEITELGIKTSEKEMEFDYIICATGYDALTGGLAQIDIKGRSSPSRTSRPESLKEHWENGTLTYLGLAVSSFPNMFIQYGPQAPTALCNGPTCAELQGDWIVGLLDYMREKGLKRIEAKSESERKWKEDVLKFANATLLPQTKSWYMGDNVPGKVREPLIFLGGVPEYLRRLGECRDGGYEGFVME
ncbi:hypothetical protein BCR34DRAFT_496742 [Clohesyomyces aquaticus]|uniref:Cyclopentanone 1,2-monooxygenase n=1 Tax=Clohesyomyces aquaticus TaxID=1231657 RepID=A0A1Y1YI21_9PLEO|nr:hypothetical protein BCR34DRAFT_496742 [Clohesyomyces aquaticus]